MCGITGWIDFTQEIKHQKSIVFSMTETLKRRGPDDGNVWCSTHALLGHRRLAVIDLVGGKQPMSKTHKNQSYTMVYNGELYNTEEIRQELKQRGYRFTTSSDTEVLLTAFIEWKEQCVNYLNGIYAFAVWDENEETLYAFRDRLGVKPFFFSQDEGSLIFGSEVKAILAHPNIAPQIDRQGLAALLSIGPSRVPGSGILKGIEELEPGCALKFSKAGLKKWRYWNVRSKKHEHTLDETVENVRFLVTDAINRQLVSDVPLCTFLSGGLDSSIITAIAANTYNKEGRTLHTYSIDFEGNEQFFEKNEFQTSQDSFWINKMTESFHSKHFDIIIGQQQLVDLLEEAMMIRDMPGMVDIDSSLLIACRVIKKDFTVALSGECADEIFGGYPWFHQDYNQFPWIRSIDEREGFLRKEWQSRLQLKEFMKYAFEDAVKDCPKLDGESSKDAKQRELFYLNMRYFMQTLLERKDRMSMGGSLEVRVPFADHRLVEYAWNIPWEIKNMGKMEKGLLRKAVEGLLPDEVLYRKKNPYPKTYHPKYTEGVQMLLKDIIRSKESVLHELFDKEQLNQLLQTGGASFKVPWFGQLMAGPQLLAYLIQIDRWFENYNVQLLDQ
ncbi:asparagine synthase (glutamine-hydrolysing) [Ureibacillus xyleni]|uniref:asparagine synthase (glutamine-hydrolyzing) n=1 Tax=Ureibacillus xyleni TaxID=614648 RepID=A0A285TSB0_9BACL|nr:asparagine synthase (glutamine-hydrolyzing) [Ureibacillus xyleni]SOC25774.1 asparagine synthase (glutamine-hydrolysing) [Ureibacillus xyleni]